MQDDQKFKYLKLPVVVTAFGLLAGCGASVESDSLNTTQTSLPAEKSFDTSVDKDSSFLDQFEKSYYDQKQAFLEEQAKKEQEAAEQQEAIAESPKAPVITPPAITTPPQKPTFGDYTPPSEQPEVIEEPVVIEQPEVIEEPVVIEQPEVIEEPEVVTEEPQQPQKPTFGDYTPPSEEPEVIEEPEVVTEEPEVIEEPEVVTEEPEVIEEPEVVTEEPEVIETPEEEPALVDETPETDVLAGSVLLGWDNSFFYDSGDILSLAEVDSYEIIYGATPATMDQTIAINDPNATEYRITDLGTGDLYFAVRVITKQGNASPFSNTVYASIE